MTINGFNIKKYRARVKAHSWQTTSSEPVSADGYKIVEGYISIANAILPYGKNEKPMFTYIFVAEEMNFNSMAFSGFGKSVFSPMVYGENEFEIMREVEENYDANSKRNTKKRFL